MNRLLNEFVKSTYVQILDDKNAVLSKDYKDIDTVKYHTYREFEYEKKLPYLIKCIFDYINNNTKASIEGEFEIKETDYSIKFFKSEFLRIKIDAELSYKNEIYTFKTDVLLPKLEHSMFFFIKNVKYIPVIKLKKPALVYGDTKILTHGLFTSIYIHFNLEEIKNEKKKNPIATIANSKLIDVLQFFKLVFKNDKDFLDELGEYLEVNFRKVKIANKIARKFATLYATLFDINENGDFGEILSNIIFDPYFKEMYEYEFGEKIVSYKELLKEVLRLIINSDKRALYIIKNLSDLKNRRFIFLEYLLRPLYDEIFNYLMKLISGQEENFTVKKDLLVKKFLKESKYLYDRISPFTSVQNMIATQMDGSEEYMFMRRLHHSFYKCICPISTSSSNPGVQMHINPNLELTKFGHVKHVFKSLKQIKEEVM